MSLKITHSDDRVLCVYVPSGHNTKKQLARGHLFKGLQNYMENKSKRNENKITLWGVKCTINKMDRVSGNKTQTLNRLGSNYVLSKLIIDDGLEGLWRGENLDSCEFTH